MDIYALTDKYWSGLPVAQTWPEMKTMFERATAGKPHDWQLPVLACEAAGGKAEQAIPAVATIACMQISIILVDDMLDTDPRGEYRRIGAPAAANLAVAFQAAGLEALEQSDLLTEVKLAAQSSVSQMMLTTALGQHLDVQNPADEETYWRIVRTKSSPYFGAALHVGALSGGASLDLAQQLRQLGHLYGEMIQIHDDFNDTMATPANPDWTEGRSPLPILFAQVVAHPERDRFLQLRRHISEPEALVEAQSILIRCGAVSYCVDQLMRRYQLAQDKLGSMALSYYDGLEALLETIIEPVHSMLEEISGGDPEAAANLARESGIPAEEASAD